MNYFGPAEVAKNYVAIGKGKVALPVSKMLLLGILAGAFIAFGGIGSTVVAVSIPYASLGKFIGACIFPAGLTMCLLAGSELFTGNCLLSIPLLEKEITVGGMLRNWIVVYAGNFIGGLLVAAAVVYSHQVSLFGNGVAASVLSTAAAKCSLSFGDAFLRGILCNVLVCIAVWISFAAKDIAGKIVGLFFPIMVFVLCGFEHCVANMYYLMAGIFAKGVDAYAAAGTEAGVDLSAINGAGIARNLLSSSLGNIVGGSVCIGLVYWFVYLYKKKGA